MKRFAIVALLLAAGAWAIVDPQTGVEMNTPVGQLTQRQLFKIVFGVNDAALDSARKWYAHHSGQSYADVTDSVLVAEILEDVRGRLRGLEQKYLQSLATTPAPTF